MQTNFSEDQLKNKDNKSSEKILRKCVHCGMCNATCPTFNLLGDELDGPRGRIYLIKEMIEKKKTPTKKVVSHIDKCLSCYSCMTTCPSGVNYMHLIDHGRNYVEKNYKRPFYQRVFRDFLSKTLPKPKIFKFLIFFSKIGQIFKFILPNNLKSMLDVAPKKIYSKTLKFQKVYKAERKKPTARVALLIGCVQRVVSPQINESTIRILTRHGVEVTTMPEIECCGSLNHHLGKEEIAKETFKKNINMWYDEYLKNGLDAIISNTSGCGTTLKDYAFIFRDDNELKKKAKKISELTKDITEFLDQNLKLNFKSDKVTKKYNIAYHSACSMQHGQKVHKQPIDLLEKTGNKILNIPDGHICCGSAGTYNILQSDIAKKLLKQKVENINKVKPDFISTGNIGCIMQITNGTNIPILHTVEVIDWYTGGPKPKSLSSLL
jgi:glycolate oxidase iron-sulfur subunit|tara:strand:- start:1081 stop:2385 length:1305 start_codon:yes stop_codon:yes gene_type:complete